MSTPRVSGVSDLAKAMRYALRHWPGLVAFLDDGRIEMDTNMVERSIRPETLTRKNAFFAGSRRWRVILPIWRRPYKTREFWRGS